MRLQEHIGVPLKVKGTGWEELVLWEAGRYAFYNIKLHFNHMCELQHYLL